MLGTIGSLISLNIRIAIASLLGLIAIILAIIELSGRNIQLLQCDRETPQRWVHRGPLWWAFQNGLALGCGIANRLGFLLWYVIPIGSLLVANPIWGLIIYGTYSTVRGMAVWVIILGLGRYHKDDLGDWLIRKKETARLLTAGQLLFLGIVITIAVGL